jgi:hypothetical protein
VTLEERIADLERRLAEALAENAALREENARLRKELEEWKRGHRERSKRRSSRAEGCRQGERKRPGRKSGHAGAFRAVPKPDRRVVHPLPGRCECGGHVKPNGETESSIEQDIPTPRIENVLHVAPVGRCTQCQRRVVAKLPGAVPGGQSVAQVQLGPNAQALILDLRYVGRMLLGCIVNVLGTWFGLQITKGGITQLVDRVRDLTEGSCFEVVEHVRGSGVVGLDETGLRQAGVNGWVWLARTPQASLFRIELSRGSWVAEALLGGGFAGVVCSDFYGVYTARQDWRHGYCWGHTLREAKKIAEVDPTPVTLGFRDELSDWYVGGPQAQLGSCFANTSRGLPSSSPGPLAALRFLRLKRDSGNAGYMARCAVTVDRLRPGLPAEVEPSPSWPYSSELGQKPPAEAACRRRRRHGTRALCGTP